MLEVLQGWVGGGWANPMMKYPREANKMLEVLQGWVVGGWANPMMKCPREANKNVGSFYRNGWVVVGEILWWNVIEKLMNMLEVSTVIGGWWLGKLILLVRLNLPWRAVTPRGPFKEQFFIVIQIRRKSHAALIQIVVKRSLWKFAHITTAALSWEVQNCVDIWNHTMKLHHNQYPIEFELRWKNRSSNEAQESWKLWL